MKYLVITLLLLSCAERPERSIDPLLDDQIEVFINEARKRGIHVSPYRAVHIEFRGLVRCSNDEGYCSGTHYGNGFIYLDMDYSENPNSIETEIILFHEMGHGYFGLPHKNDTLNLMNEMLIRKEEYQPNREEILDKYFSQACDFGFCPSY